MKKKLLTLTAVFALVAVVALVFTACLPTDPEDAKERLTAADYQVSVFSPDNAIGKAAILAAEESIGIEGIECMIYALKGSLSISDADVEYIIMYYFDTADNAKAAYAKLTEEMKKEDADEESEYGRSGKMIYGGTKAAVAVIK